MLLLCDSRVLICKAENEKKYLVSYNKKVSYFVYHTILHTKPSYSLLYILTILFILLQLLRDGESMLIQTIHACLYNKMFIERYNCNFNIRHNHDHRRWPLGGWEET